MYKHNIIRQVPVFEITHGSICYTRLFSRKIAQPDIHESEFVHTYQDDLLLISNGSFEEQLLQTGKVLQILCSA